MLRSLKLKLILRPFIKSFFKTYQGEIFLGLVFCFWYLVLLPAIPIFDGDTFYYIAKARRMLGAGDLLNTATLMAKPVLVLWVMALFYKLLGVSLAATYLWHTLFAAGILIVVYKFVLDFTGRAAARISAAVLMTSLMFFYQTCSPMLDIPMLFFLVVSQYFLFKFISSGKSSYLYLTALFCGLNFLTKGLEGALIPPITFILYLLTNRINPFKKYKNILPQAAVAAVIFLAIVAVWLVPQVQAHGRDFFRLLYRENIERFFHPIDETGGYRHVSSGVQVDPQLNLLYLLLAFLPWSPLLIPAILTIYRNKYFKLRPFLSFQLLWFYFLLIITSVSGHYKGPRYLLPLLPALAMILGVYLDNVSSYCKKTVFRSFYGTGLFFLVLLLVLLNAKFQHGEEQYLPLLVSFLIFMSVTMLAGGYYWKNENFRKAFWALFFGTIITYTIFLSQGSYYVKKLLPEYSSAVYIRKHLPAGAGLVVWNIKIHSLDFYLKRDLKYISGTEELRKIPRGEYLVAEKTELDTLRAKRPGCRLIYQNQSWLIARI